MYPTEMLTYVNQNTCTGMVTEALLGNSQKLKTTNYKCPPTGDWVKYSIFTQWNTMQPKTKEL